MYDYLFQKFSFEWYEEVYICSSQDNVLFIGDKRESYSPHIMSL